MSVNNNSCIKDFYETNCRVDKLTMSLGVTMVVTGIALLIFDAFLTAPLLLPGSIILGCGGFIFMLGLITHCCNVVNCGGSSSTSQTSNKNSTVNITATYTPVDLSKSTKDFFEEAGLFGLPRELFNELDIWRQYRNQNQQSQNNLQISLDAGFIFDGNPGMGKTAVAKKIAELLGGEYYEMGSGDLKSPKYGKSEENISKLFEIPNGVFRIIVIDEIDGLLPKRNGWWTDEVITHFLGKVQGSNATDSQTIQNYIIIGTTNNYNKLDAAVCRDGRLGKRFTLTAPSKSARKKIFKFHLAKMTAFLDPSQNWDDTFMQKLADHTDCKTGAQIHGLLNEIKKSSLLKKQKLTQDEVITIVSGKKIIDVDNSQSEEEDN